MSFTPTPETPEARGVLELHTEKGSFAVPVNLSVTALAGKAQALNSSFALLVPSHQL